MKRAGVRDGLLLLDEVDKMGRDARGDPAAALLEARQASLHAFVWLLPRNQHDAAPAAPPPPLSWRFSGVSDVHAPLQRHVDALSPIFRHVLPPAAVAKSWHEERKI